MTTTAETVRDYANSPVLAISLPDPGLLPAAVRPAVERFQSARAAAAEATGAEAMALAPEHGTIAVAEDHKLLAEGRAPKHVAQLERDRATTRAKAINARRELHDLWFEETLPALNAHRGEITAHAASQALAAVERWRAAVAALPPVRDDLQRSLQLVGFAQARSSVPSWPDNAQQGSATIGRVTVAPMTAHEVMSSLVRGLADLTTALEALTAPTP